MEFVLVCKTETATPSLREVTGLQILRTNARLFLVEFWGEEEELRALLGAGWVVSPQRRYQLC